jgi:hypothetical protein
MTFPRHLLTWTSKKVFVIPGELDVGVPGVQVTDRGSWSVWSDYKYITISVHFGFNRLELLVSNETFSPLSDTPVG